MSYLPYLLEALPSVRQPGKIVGPFADLMGKVYNLLFELLHSNTSADPVSSDGEAAEVFF